MKKIVSSIVLLLLYCGIVSANGLIITPTSFSINKTVGINYPITFQIYNSESMTFYNIQSDNTTILTFPTISSLASGQAINITASYVGNNNFNGMIKVYGLYNATIGASHQTKYINISGSNYFVNGCPISIVAGDTLVFNNIAEYHIYLVRGVAGVTNLGTLNSNAIAYNNSFTQLFPTTQSFDFYAALAPGGFPYGDNTCHVDVNSDTGLIRDRNFDGIINVNVLTSYISTSISTTTLVTNYSMNFYESTDGQMLIANSGNNTAYNILLSGEWFNFNNNNFNLNPGQSKVVSYTINPIITNTQDTNKTYNKQILINGNFNTVNQSISIFINYANIENLSSMSGNITTVLASFCMQYPKSQFCNPDPQIVYKYITNGSDASFNFTLTQDQFRDMWINIIKNDNARLILDSYIKEQMSLLSNSTTITSGDIATLKQIILDDKAKQESDSTGLTIFIIIIFLIAAFAVVLFLIFYYRAKKQREFLRRY